jgi:transcriptional regulator with XRE-family HTH domain
MKIDLKDAMRTINERLKEIRTSLNISQREFSKRIFISQSLYADIEIGNVECKERFIRLISSQFNVNLDWIKTGEGEMFASSPPDLRLEYLIDIFNQLDPQLQDCVLDHLKGLLKVQKARG